MVISLFFGPAPGDLSPRVTVVGERGGVEYTFTVQQEFIIITKENNFASIVEYKYMALGFLTLTKELFVHCTFYT